MKFLMCVLLLLSLSAWAQIRKPINDIQMKLQKVDHMPYICEGSFEIGKFGCGDALFWEVVKQKEEVIAELIELISDTTHTQVYFPNYGGLMTVADVAQTALSEIIQPLPRPNEFFEIEEMDGSQWMANVHWLQIKDENRAAYRDALTVWYKENKSSLVWITSDRFMCGDLGGIHPNKGHYSLNKKQ